ncbi:hypothetical protein ACFS07_32500 [Undibacterium arcticum]
MRSIFDPSLKRPAKRVSTSLCRSRKTISFEEAKRICELIGRHVVAAHPDEVTMEWSISKRTGKIFIDHNMNGQGRTLHAAYSPRAQPGGTFSMPIRWDELPTINPANFRITAIDKNHAGKNKTHGPPFF